MLASEAKALESLEAASRDRELPANSAPCVVAIDGFDKGEQTPSSRGSGIVIGAHHLVTCWHVVQRRERSPFGQDVLKEEPWSQLRLVGDSSSLQCIAHDAELDVALLYSPSRLEVPAAQWLDDSSLRQWLERPAPWVALGYPEATRQLSRHRGMNWLGENPNHIQLEGGIPAGFSGGALATEEGKLYAGLVQLGGKKSPTSVALPVTQIEAFLARHGRKVGIKLERVRWSAPIKRPLGHRLIVAGAILGVFMALALTLSILLRRPNQSVTTHGEQSPGMLNSSGTVIYGSPPSAAAPVKEAKP